MGLQKVEIYRVMHTADSVEDHLSQLENLSTDPEVVFMEIPEEQEMEETYPMVDELKYKSPITAYYLKKTWDRNRELMERSESSDGGGNEFDALKKYADSKSIPWRRVDMPRRKAIQEYVSIRMIIRDHVAFLVYLIFKILGVGLASLLFLSAVGAYVQTGLGISVLVLIISSIVALISTIKLLPFGYKFLVGDKILKNLMDGINEIRDRYMVENMLETSAEMDVKSGLLGVGSRHYYSLNEKLGELEIEVLELKSPSSKQMGEIEDLPSLEEFEKYLG